MTTDIFHTSAHFINNASFFVNTGIYKNITTHFKYLKIHWNIHRISQGENQFVKAGERGGEKVLERSLTLKVFEQQDTKYKTL